MKAPKLVRKILYFFNLESDLENQDSVYAEIKKGIIFKSTNLWILIFATIVASVGLNMNSTSVVIGAMLISPLMGPINGMGYSIATYDLRLFRIALKNFVFAIVASLIASTSYFAISPISTAHSELLARTSPTIYDVVIALFGGLAGIVAISSKLKGNVIPGVAIATALMPPLCTAGYGLATGQFNFFFGAFYLFTINSIFIGIASVWVSQLLKFQIRTVVEESKKIKINRIINLVVIIVLLPSIYFGYKLVKQEEFLENANEYVLDVSHIEGNYLLNYDIHPKSRKIVLVYGGTTLLDKHKTDIIQRSFDFGINDAHIIIEQGLAFSRIDDKNPNVSKLKEQVIGISATLDKKNLELDSVLNQQKLGNTLFNEIKTIYPQIKGCSYSEPLFYHDTLSAPIPRSIVILSVNGRLSTDDKSKINSWFMQRLQRRIVKVLYE